MSKRRQESDEGEVKPKRARTRHVQHRSDESSHSESDPVPSDQTFSGISFPVEVSGGKGRTYIIKLSAAGTPYCNCMGWVFNKQVPKTCKHIKQLGASSTTASSHPPKEMAQGLKVAQAETSPHGYPAPMKLEYLDVEAIGPYLEDVDWVAEQKVDGIKCTTRVTPDGIHHFGSSTGEKLMSSVAGQYFGILSKALPTLKHEYLIDGELLWTGEYFVFDLLKIDGKDIEKEPFETRRAKLEQFLSQSAIKEPIYLLPQKRTKEAKRHLLAKLLKEGAEGIVLKHRESLYEEGTRSMKQLKAKFRKTCDCIVTGRNTKGRQNAQLAVWDGETLRDVGSCSMIGKPNAHVGQVVEVAYLYASEHLHLYQPSLVRIREDKPAKQCTVDQLVPVNKRVYTEEDLKQIKP